MKNYLNFFIAIAIFFNQSCNNELTTDSINHASFELNQNIPDSSNERPIEGNGCKNRCSGNGSECSVWNPGVCGSICQLRTSVNIFAINKTTKGISSDLLDFFPSLYELRDVLDGYQKGREIVDNYYRIGDLYLSGSVEISVQNQKMIVLEILSKSSLILEFSNNKNSSSILLDSEEVSNYLQMINNLRQDSVNTEYQEVLDFFENKLMEVENKTIYEIYTLL